MSGNSRMPEAERMEAAIQQLEVPDIYCPFPSETSPYGDEIEAHTLDWAEDMNLLTPTPDPSSLRVGPHFACHVHPTASDRLLQFIAKWYCWGFLEDDTRDESALRRQPRQMAEYQQSFLQVLNDDDAEHRTPLSRAFADLQDRWGRLGTAEWRARFKRHHLRYFAAHRWEARNQVQGYVPTRNEYVTNTRVAAGIPLVFDLAALAGDVVRSRSLYRSPIYQELLETAGNVICWTNDVYSLHRELRNDEVNNLIVVIHEEQNCSLQEAIVTVSDLIAGESSAFEKLRRQVSEEFADVEGLQSHLAQVAQAIGGHLAYSEQTARYEVLD